MEDGQRRWVVAVVVGCAAVVVWPLAALTDRAVSATAELHVLSLRFPGIVDLGHLGVVVLAPLTVIVIGVTGLTTVGRSRLAVLVATGWVVGAAAVALLVFLVVSLLGFLFDPMMQGLAGH